MRRIEQLLVALEEQRETTAELHVVIKTLPAKLRELMNRLLAGNTKHRLILESRFEFQVVDAFATHITGNYLAFR